MSDTVSIHLNKQDLRKSIADMKKDEKMIDLPVFASLKTAVEKWLGAHPDYTIQDIKFDKAVAEPTTDIIEVIVYFKSIA